MRRFVLVAVLMGGVAAIGVRGSSADQPVVDCSQGNFVQYCVATPAPTSFPSHSPLIPAVKTLDVGEGTEGPAGLLQVPVTITSQLVCFSLTEPVELYALGTASSSVIVPISPPGTSSIGSAHVQVDPDTGQAALQLEVDSSVASISGVDLKAIWPRERVEQIANVLPPATPTDTPTVGPGTPTNTPAPTETPTSSPTPGPSPMPSPTQTPVPPPFGVDVCADPSIIEGTTLNAGGDSTAIYGLTTPGAVCTAAVTYYSTYDFLDYQDQFITGTSHPDATSFDGSAQVAAEDNLVVYPLSEATTANFGIATVKCSSDSLPAVTGCSAFLIAQTDTQDYLNSLSPADVRALIHKLAVNHCPAGSTTP
jgi:hypothetical protein